MRQEIAVVAGIVAVLGCGHILAHADDIGQRPATSYSWGSAHVAVVERDYEAAIHHLAEVLAAAPDSWEAQRLMGDCLLHLGRPAPAAVHYREWARLRPADADAARAAEAATHHARRLEEEEQSRAQRRAVALRPPPADIPLGAVSPTRARFASKVPVYVMHGTPGESAAAIPRGGAPGLLESMRHRAQDVLRPRMSAVASDARQLQQVRRRYDDACAGQTTSTTENGVREGVAVQESGGYDSQSGRERPRRWSATSWIERWRSVATVRNEETPQCRALSSDITALSSRVEAALVGSDQDLASPPSVYPGVRDQVFDQLVAELW